MADGGLDMMTGGPSGPGRRRAAAPPRKPWGRRIVTLLVLLAVLFGGYKVAGKAMDFFGGPADYPGQGTGSVVVEIPSGANGQQIANILKEADVVKSAEAFYQLSLNDSRFQAVQAGFFKLRKHMSAEWAMRELTDRNNRVEGKVTIPEGARVTTIITIIAKSTDISKKNVEAALDKPQSLGLPAEANNNPEGFLYPATYEVPPGSTATSLLKQMVKKTVDVEKELDLASRADAIGMTPVEVMTLASILEYEANRDEDYPKVARVFLNRLDQGIALQSDATVAYANGITGDVWTTPEQRDNPSEYNTYEHQGLPPGPIGAAGKKTIEAVLNPADGDWLYFVPDYENNTTVFSNNLADHERAAERLREWCRSSKDTDDIC
ncbi:UPF0755 protein [Aeromicrobium panaciterrae]|uniref:Endolytic murein transglycosylase n=1 Tax=Aeromicrobium panaciterrae TaxID=363861 RepID=A0ABU1UNI3_9ACTN|nr:endolytic transglycosylase MltG [Aeromicrobium panaciterrae]MDR7086742.1 UPF0755 protein [Aeromicrobium panaciterrae]